MDEHGKLIKEAELALNNGEYNYCIEKLEPFIDTLPLSTKEGINLRFILITAFSAINKKDKAIIFCKQLLKSNYSHVRENARSLIEILNSPKLNTPENWNINFEKKLPDEKGTYEVESNKINTPKPERYINIVDIPTGETKPFKKGFVSLVFILLFFIIFLLGGCVRIESKIDLKDPSAIDITHKVTSKFETKIPWQFDFENKLKNRFKNSEIIEDKKNFILKNKNIDIEKIELLLNDFYETAADSTDIRFRDLEVKYNVINYFIGKRYFFDININLNDLEEIQDLEILMHIINPSRVKVSNLNENIEVTKNNISWRIKTGKMNYLSFRFWYWNKILISAIVVINIVLAAYIIRNNRYELGSNLPRLPS